MSKKSIFYTVFFVVLAVGFYFILTKVIPGYGKKRSPTISYVRSFAFTNQDGKTVTNEDVKGKVYVAEYFYTTCVGICPRMNNNMKKVYEAFKGNKDFMILSHTSDPGTDSPAVLKKYADSLGVDTKQWVFLTGRKDSLYDMARVSYTIDDPKNNLKSIDDQFLHTQLWALVDKKGNVRKMTYDGILSKEVNELIEDAKRLLKEKGD
jgi:protein SCO1/2